MNNILERIYYDYDNYAGPGVPHAILSRRSTTIFMFIERYLASYKPLYTRSQRVAAAREKGASRVLLMSLDSSEHVCFPTFCFSNFEKLEYRY